MANEITTIVGLRVTNGALQLTVPTQTKQYTNTAARAGGPGTQAVGTTQETVSFGDVTPSHVVMTNLDTTNFVKYGTVTGNLGLIIPAGGSQLISVLAGQTLYVQADTATCLVQITAAG
jgi:hypothetical protein